MRNFEESKRVSQRLSEMKVAISINDFGLKCSSLGHLRSLNIDRIKVNRFFVQGLEGSNDSRMLISAIIGLAEKLELGIVAEGVETREQAEFLKSEGCDKLQGYYFSKPIQAHHALPLLHKANQTLN